MNFVRRHWYDIGLGIAVTLLLTEVFLRFDGLRLILLLNLVVLLVHQFEEYHLPGGEPWVINEVFQPKGGPADRYPLNQNNAAFINIAGWLFYAIAIFAPSIVWLGLAPVLFGFGQLFIHGIVNNRQLKTLYNPGPAAVILGHTPLGIWYLVEAYGQSLVHWWDWAFAVVYLAFFMGFVMNFLGYGVLASKESKYPFTHVEMTRFDRIRRLERAGVVPLPLDPPATVTE